MSYSQINEIMIDSGNGHRAMMQNTVCEKYYDSFMQLVWQFSVIHTSVFKPIQL